MFKTKMLLILLLFYLVASILLSDNVNKVIVPHQSLNSIIAGIANLTTSNINTFIQSINSANIGHLIILFLIAVGIAALFSLAIGRGVRRILNHTDRLCSGDYLAKMPEKGLFSQVDRSMNRLSALLAEKKRKETTSATEERNASADVLRRTSILLAEGKGKLDVLVSCQVFPDSSYEMKLLSDIRDSLNQASDLVESRITGIEKGKA